MKFLSLFIYFLLLFLTVNSNKVTLFDYDINSDTYANDGICNPIFTISYNSLATITSINIHTNLVIQNINLVYVQGDSRLYKIKTSQNVGSNNISISNIKISFSDSTNLDFNLDSNITIPDCINVPLITLQWDQNQYILTTVPTPSEIYYTLKIWPTIKPLQISISPPSSTMQYFLSLVDVISNKNEKYNLVRFKLSFDFLLPSKSDLTNLISYPIKFGIPGYSIQLNLISPIANYSNEICSEITNYTPRGGQNTSFNYWDAGSLTTCKTYQPTTNLFLYNYIDNLQDSNRWFKMISGNSSSSTFMLSSFYKYSFRPLGNIKYDTYLYNHNQVQSNLLNLETIPTSMASAQVKYNNSDNVKYSFNIIYPFKFSFATKLELLGNYNEFKYPYGVGAGIVTLFEYKISKRYNRSIEICSFTQYTNLGNVSLISAPASIDVKVPTIIDLQIYYPRYGDGKNAVLTTRIIDSLSGFSFLEYCENLITVQDLVNGTIYDGFYEKVIDVTFCKTGITVSDRSGNFLKMDEYYTIDPIPKLIPFISALNNGGVIYGKNQIGQLNVTLFKFDSFNLNIDDGALQTLKFDYENSSYDIPVSFYLLDPSSNNGDRLIIDPIQSDALYLKSRDENLFNIYFYIPPRYCTKNLKYEMKIDGQIYSMDYFFSLFGDNAKLSISNTNNECDEMPPLITDINLMYGAKTINIQSDLKVGWILKIKDQFGGLKSSYFRVVSNWDPMVYEVYNPQPKSGDKFSGEYEISFTATTDTIGQTYSFEQIILIDESGHRSELKSKFTPDAENTLAPLSPFYNLNSSCLPNLEFTVVTHFGVPDSTPPVVTIFTLSDDFLTGPEQDFKVTFQIQDNIQIRREHIPIVYMDKFENSKKDSRIECVSKELDYQFTLANYEAICKIPYQYSVTSGIVFSLFGLVDTTYNLNGYTSKDLEELGFTSFKSYTPISYKIPFINDHTTLSIHGGPLTIFGRDFTNEPTITASYSNGTLLDSINKIYSSNNLLIIYFSKSIKSPTIYIYLTSFDIYNSNIVEITTADIPIIPTPTPSPTPTTTPIIKIPCLNNCGGEKRGECIIDVGCRCIHPYSGVDCLSEIIKVPQPIFNITTPNTVNEFPIDENGEIRINTIISILALREFNFNGDIENQFYFNQWNYTKFTDTKYSYTSNILKNNQPTLSTITVIIEWFNKETVINFANKNFTLNPSTLKYTITIEDYPFTNTLNELELIFKNSIETSKTSDICSSNQFGENDGIDYLQLQVGDISFYSKFLKDAIIDNSIKTIRNSYLNDFNDLTTSTNVTASSHNQFSYIGIKIPWFNDKIIMDPDFSVLLSSDYANSNSVNSICSNDNNGLTKSQIAGIIVGSVVFAIIIIIIIILLLPSTLKLSLKIYFYRLLKKSNKKY